MSSFLSVDAPNATRAVPNGLLASTCVDVTSARQKTLCGVAQCSGVGVHSGEKVTLRLLPAEPDTGIVFIRTDLKNGARAIPARWDFVVETQLCTVIGNPQGGKVATIEHLMAALRAADVDNAIVEVDGPEVPVMDGSADSFVFLIEMAGVKEQNAPRREIVIVKPVEVSMNGKHVSLMPADSAQFSVEIAFDNALIGQQRYDLMLSRQAFKAEVSRARTFGFLKDVEKMTAIGLMRGGSLDNAIVIDGDRIMNEGGLRYGNEFVRHKTLDAVGDIALAGAPIRGHYKGVLPGHAMNNALLRALFTDPTAFVIEEASADHHLAASV
ncbi:MAG TPA: UDP-3-O-[3-hydroxymyristoyl] N-acetylglucosamine deacetylase [Rhodospirillaceae bacterium]|nr:UDP-3-O-[3-hydroxymyristoyl] N-acetylglucosamine deacetylase [Rhodospirillaceae bacterium]